MFLAKSFFAVLLVFALGTTGESFEAEDQLQEKVDRAIWEKKEATELGDNLLKGIELGSDGFGNALKLKWNPAENPAPRIILSDADGNEKNLQYQIDTRHVIKKRATDWRIGLGRTGGRTSLNGRIGGRFGRGRGSWNIGGSHTFGGGTNFNAGVTWRFG